MQLKTYLLLFTLCCVCTLSYAQDRSDLKGITFIAEDDNEEVDLNKSFKIAPAKGLTNKKLFQPKINYTPLLSPFKKKSGVNIVAKSKLKKPTWDVKQKFTEDYQNVSQFSRDFNLGDLRTTSKTLIIECRDHEYVDGDRIKLMINNAVIHPNLTLTGQFYVVDVDLKPGHNTINFIALNEGSSRPNTAQLRVFDEDGQLLTSKRWLLTTGYKASLTVLKE